ncbi:hypothetical protein O3G_MSEX006406 [Manduca sexta]|uniref:WAP domain-containing protein n=1 Tax=Manduca sexta TaxID=7130 RepID=A0A922CLT2_MANSE|nr:hypothetical protein O3G_MSEX006406 [Manduca sexta]KAG6450123.1 hypothetical protein O3G_MSEX006406 [Manduca sexta]
MSRYFIFVIVSLLIAMAVFSPAAEAQGKAGRCPQVRPGSGGACASLCTSDNSCPGPQKCCSNGCGRSCITPRS